MRLALIHDPDTPGAAVTGIAVDVARSRAGCLVLGYVVTGDIGAVRMPGAAAPERTDGLWRHTCFEAFVGFSAGGGYYEFNFAPSKQWAAYRFTAYRCGMAVADGIAAPAIAVEQAPERYALQATLALHRLPGLSSTAPWRLGLSAVIEESSGRISYWALAHPPGKPDFHHAACFACDLFPA